MAMPTAALVSGTFATVGAFISHGDPNLRRKSDSSRTRDRRDSHLSRQIYVRLMEVADG
jgi:hypothetical protein